MRTLRRNWWNFSSAPSQTKSMALAERASRLARMLESGEDPPYLARRMVRMASEDIGLAEPGALAITLAAKEAFHFLGAPEGNLALAQAAVYLSLAPKSNALYSAYGNVQEDVQKTEADPVPLHLRNAPTGLMKNLGYGKEYQYAHNFEQKVTVRQSRPELPQITGNDHVAIYRSDLKATRDFYAKVGLNEGGAGCDRGIHNCFTVNWATRQRIEIALSSSCPNNDCLGEIVFRTANAQKLRDFLVARGIK